MTALATLLANPAQEIAFVVRFEERDPDADIVTERHYATPNWRGSEGYGRYLADPGGRSDRMEVDELEAVSAQTIAPIRLRNEPTAPGGAGPLDFLRERSLAGRPITILAGAPDEAIANYEAVSGGAMDREPVFDGNVVEIRIQSALERLNVDLDVGTYVGEPGALRNIVAVGGSGRASASYSADHDLTSFTVAVRARFTSGGVTEVVVQKGNTGTAINFQISQLSGVISARWTESAALRTLAGSAATGKYQVVVFGLDAGRNAYVMVDGEVIATAVPGTPDRPAVGVRFGNSAKMGLEWLDTRLFNHYIAPDAMRAAMAVRASGDEEGLVGLWRGDDQTGSTITDYSSTGAHATLSGTEGVDYEHVSSDLGTEELAGRSMPVVLGQFGHAPADLVSPVFERWRYHDTESPASLYNLQAKDEGELLTVTTDYDDDGGVIALVSPAGEPVTVGFQDDDGDLPGWPTTVIEALMTRTPAGVIHHTRAFGAAYPNIVGLHTRRVTAREPIAEIIAGGLGYAATRMDTGRLESGVLVPPTSPSPRDGACVEIISPTLDGDGRIGWTGTTDPSADFTLACWIKSHRWGPSELSNDRINLIDLSNNNATILRAPRLVLDIGSGVTRLVLERYEHATAAAQASVSSGFGRFFDGEALGTWFFIAVVHDQTSGQTRFYAAPEGESLNAIGTAGDLNFPSAIQSTYVGIGGLAEVSGVDRDRHFFGSVYEPQVWDDRLTLVQLQALMDAAPAGNEAGLAFYAPLDGTGVASLTDTVSSAVGAILGDVRQVPDLELDLALLQPAEWTTRRVRPAHEIRVEYGRNFAVLDEGQIAATVDQQQRLALRTPGRFVEWRDPSIAADYLDSRSVTVPALWSTKQGALSAMRVARYRFAPGREIADLSNGGRRAVLLSVGNEVRLRGGSRWGLDADPVYRVTEVAPQLASLTAKLGLFR